MPNWNENISRRKAIQGAVVTAGALSFPWLFRTDSAPRQELSPLDQFKHNFAGANAAYNRLHTTFGADPLSDVPDPIANSLNLNRNIWRFMEATMQNQLTPDEAKLHFMQGWLPEKTSIPHEDLQKAALKKLSQQTIKLQSGTNVPLSDYPHLYKVLTTIAHVMPLVFIYGVDSFAAVKTTAEAFATYGIDAKTITGTLSVTESFLEQNEPLTEAHLIALVHELAHTEGTFLNSPHNAKQYVHQKDYAKFLQTKADALFDIAKAYFSTEWDTSNSDLPFEQRIHLGRYFNFGGTLFDITGSVDEAKSRTIHTTLPVDFNHQMHVLLDGRSELIGTSYVDNKGIENTYISLEELERQMTVGYGLHLTPFNYEQFYHNNDITVQYMKESTPRQAEDALTNVTGPMSRRLNEIIHAIGGLLVRREITNTQDFRTHQLMQLMFGNLEHYLVGPVQVQITGENAEQHLVRSDHPRTDTHPLTVANKKMQHARLQLLATGLGEARFSMNEDQILNAFAEKVLPALAA